MASASRLAAGLMLLLLFIAAARAQGPVFSLVGRSTHMRLSQGNSSVDLRIGKVFEADSSGFPVLGHALPALASLQPSITNGTTQFGGVAASFVTLQIANLASVPGFNATSCPGGAAPMPSAVPLSSAFINVTVLYSFSGNATIPYGNGTANATAGSVKWNLDAQGWPFCSASNQLMVELAVYSASRPEDQPVLFDDNGDNNTAPSGATTAPPPARHLLHARDGDGDAGGSNRPQQGGANGGRPSNAQDGRPDQNNANGTRPADGGDHPEPRISRPDPNSRPPHEGHGFHGPNGRAPRLVAMLLSPDAAAALNIDTVAFDTNVNPTTVYNVTVYMKPNKEAEDINGTPVNTTKVLLGFPAFTTLHYDPSVELTSPTDLGYTVNTTAVNSTAVNSTVAAPQNGAHVARMGAQAALGAVIALVAVVLL